MDSSINKELAAPAVASGVVQLPGKSWTAYIGPGLKTFIAFLIFLWISRDVFAGRAEWRTFNQISLFVVTVFLLRSIYLILLTRSVNFFYDEDGVWVYSGVFPWNKGVVGAKWKDIDEAVFYTGMFSWMFKSYTVRINNRYKKENEVVLPHMKRGHESVSEINGIHIEKVHRT